MIRRRLKINAQKCRACEGTFATAQPKWSWWLGKKLQWQCPFCDSTALDEINTTPAGTIVFTA